ncbi:hypothetical protein NQ317_019103 [Molorchus minor]|uniref:Tetraspanin n=1 Tax=Molorchus minor TaxID=1323400 RepID=A0ABQ9JML7_9CUCU|nr:hypothetical protein NQ317_019103 [Molorchus minor]
MDCSAILRSYSRLILILLNLVFLVTGIIVISVGISAKAYYNEFDKFLDPKYIYISDLLIIIGAIIFIVAFLGCCGAVKENAFVTTTFSTLLVVIFVLEVVAVIGGVVLKHKAENLVVQTLKDTMKEYGNDTEITDTWDRVQTEFKCCGVTNFTDWNFNNSTTEYLPKSCCAKLVESTCPADKAYETGCLDELVHYAKTHTTIIEVVGLTMTLIQYVK